MRCLEDSGGLEEIGLTMAFPSELLSTLSEKGPVVLYEDARARVYNAYILNLTQEISGSMSWWTSHYPGKMAAALSETTAYESLQALKKACEAWWYCKDTPAAPPTHAIILGTFADEHAAPLRPNAWQGGHVSRGWRLGLTSVASLFSVARTPCVQTFPNSARIWVTASGG